MDRGYIFLIAIFAIGLVYGLARGSRQSERSRSGWRGLGVLVFLFFGLFVSVQLESESLTWFFGLSLMVVLPVLLLASIGLAVGRRLGPKRSGSAGRSNR